MAAKLTDEIKTTLSLLDARMDDYQRRIREAMDAGEYDLAAPLVEGRVALGLLRADMSSLFQRQVTAYDDLASID